jgi:hypothetical protein
MTAVEIDGPDVPSRLDDPLSVVPIDGHRPIRHAAAVWRNRWLPEVSHREPRARTRRDLDLEARADLHARFAVEASLRGVDDEAAVRRPRRGRPASCNPAGLATGAADDVNAVAALPRSERDRAAVR